MLVLIAVIIVVLRKAFIKFKVSNQDRHLSLASRMIADQPFASFFFTTFLVTKLLFPDAPRLFGDVIMLLVLVSSLPILHLYLHKHFKNILYFIITFFILDNAKTYIWFTSFQYRLYLLFEAALVLGTVYYFTYPFLKTIKLPLSRISTFMLKISPLLYFFSIVSIVSNILGYTNLTDLSLKLCTQGSVSAVILICIALIVLGFVSGYIHRHFSKHRHLDQSKKDIAQQKAIKIILVTAIISWFLIFLKMTDVLKPIGDYLSDVLTEPYIIGSITITGGEVLTFLLILIISFTITSFIAFLLDESKFGAVGFLKLPKGVPAAISLVIRYLIQGFAIVFALSALGVDLSKFNLMAGALGLGIGFGLQTIVSNFISGLILVFERPILIGDSVEVNNLLGKVSRIGVRSSSITTFDGAEVVVPNNNLISNDLINWTLSSNIKRIEVLVGTTYDADPNEVLKILVAAAEECDLVLKSPVPVALFNDFGDSSLNFRVLFWVYYQNGLESKSAVSINIYNQFKKAGIEIPFPQTDVHIKDKPSSDKTDV